MVLMWKLHKLAVCPFYSAYVEVTQAGCLSVLYCLCRSHTSWLSVRFMVLMKKSHKLAVCMFYVAYVEVAQAGCSPFCGAYVEVTQAGCLSV